MKQKENKNLKLGFTLLELLVVVLIIGILAAIALPQYKKAVLKSRFATMKDIVRVVTEAEQRYYLINGEYTLNSKDLDIEYKLDKYDRISFNDGYCSINWWSKPSEGIICILTTNPKISLMLQYNSKQKTCRVHSTLGNTIQDEICKQETGKTKPDKSENSNYYYY